jgi:hypothetical protein
MPTMLCRIRETIKMQRRNMHRTEKQELAISLVCLLLLGYSSIGQAADPNQDILKNIIDGVAHNDSLITSVSFDYVVDYNVSDGWRKAQLGRLKQRQPELPANLRPRTLEHTVRSGAGRFEGTNIYTTSKVVATTDGNVFVDEVISHDGTIFTQLDLTQNHATISSRERLPLSYDPRKYALWFADGQPLHSWLTEPNAVCTVVGTEPIEGTMCHVVERIKEFVTPDGSRETARGKCWIAPEKGFLVKKAIAFSTKSPDKPLSVTKCSLTKVAEGIWCYSKVGFESYPFFLTKPDVTVVVEFKNIAVNRQFERIGFTVPFPVGCLVNDQVRGVRYTVGQ